MSHLTLEALARLLDEPPEPGERAHLADCAACREELDALRDQTATLATLPRMVPPPDLWPELRERLADERLLREPARRRLAGPLRAAAAVVLFLGGGTLGYAVRGVSGAPAIGETEGSALAGGAASEVLDSSPGPVAMEPAGDRPAAGGLREVEQAQEAFLSALDQYMTGTVTSPSDPATRLATLDNIVLTTAEALNDAPADPVINSFHLTALAQRNAMLRQIATRSEPVF